MNEKPDYAFDVLLQESCGKTSKTTIITGLVKGMSKEDRADFRQFLTYQMEIWAKMHNDKLGAVKVEE